MAVSIIHYWCEQLNFAEMENNGRMKKFKCDLCSMDFLQVKILKLHKKTEHEGINFKCDQCGKGFSVHKKMKKHISIVHEGKRDFKCEVCLETFTASGNLRKHMSIVHEGKERLTNVEI